ncbi:MAG: stage III sporulation protein AB [Eubacteriaceae bacterium]|nr:stage III sporulation protein AB [Eubacteriaceae bacterium]
MAKHIGYILIMAASYAVGTLISSSYSACLKEVSTMRSIAIDIRETIKLAAIPIHEIFKAYSHGDDNPFIEAFKNAAASLEHGRESASQAFSREVGKLALDSGQDALQAILSVGESLSLPDRERILAALSISINRLAAAEAAAKETLEQKGALARKLSLAAGAFIIILIV